MDRLRFPCHRRIMDRSTCRRRLTEAKPRRSRSGTAGGPALTQELFYDDWAPRTFAGLRNPPAVPQTLRRRELAPYEGHYEADVIEPNGAVTKTECELRADRGQLRVTTGSTVTAHLAFYRKDTPWCSTRPDNLAAPSATSCATPTGASSGGCPAGTAIPRTPIARNPRGSPAPRPRPRERIPGVRTRAGTHRSINPTDTAAGRRPIQ
jgi:hypothetical protein